MTLVLVPYDLKDKRISVSGPTVRCGSSIAASMALLMHEFATNSIKYGALSDASGRVSLTWELADKLTLVWHETGGPLVAPPGEDNPGFGSVLVAATVAGLRGVISREWEEGGVCIRVTAPLGSLSN